MAKAVEDLNVTTQYRVRFGTRIAHTGDDTKDFELGKEIFVKLLVSSCYLEPGLVSRMYSFVQSPNGVPCSATFVESAYKERGLSEDGEGRVAYFTRLRFPINPSVTEQIRGLCELGTQQEADADHGAIYKAILDLL